MQETISRCRADSTQSAWTDSYYGGFSCGSNLATQLSKCSSLTFFNGYQFRYNGEIDFTNTQITNLLSYGNTVFKLPATCKTFSTQNGKLADTSACRLLETVRINQGWDGDLENFVKGLKNNDVEFEFILTPISSCSQLSYPELNYLSESKVKSIEIRNNGNFTFDNLNLDFSQSTDEDSETCFEN